MSITRTISLAWVLGCVAASCFGQKPAAAVNAPQSAIAHTPEPKPAVNSAQPKPGVKPAVISTQAKPVLKPAVISTQAKPVVKPAVISTQAKPVVKPAVISTQAKPVAKPAVISTAQAKPESKLDAKAEPKLQKTSAAAPDVSAIKPVLPPAPVIDTHKYASRRDPFVNPIVRQSNDHSANCSTGKRCLVIGQLTLKGIIIADSGILAIVENAATRTYFLRVNDPLFDGVVERITRDSITFRENVSDSLGRPLGSREVVKKIVAPAA